MSVFGGLETLFGSAVRTQKPPAVDEIKRRVFGCTARHVNVRHASAARDFVSLLKKRQLFVGVDGCRGL
jgi:hypothetical protein